MKQTSWDSGDSYALPKILSTVGKGSEKICIYIYIKGPLFKKKQGSLNSLNYFGLYFFPPKYCALFLVGIIHHDAKVSEVELGSSHVFCRQKGHP